MNAHDCMMNASPEVAHLTARCVKAQMDILEGVAVGDSLEAVGRAAAIMATACAADGREAAVVGTLCAIIASLTGERVTIIPTQHATPKVLQ